MANATQDTQKTQVTDTKETKPVIKIWYHSIGQLSGSLYHAMPTWKVYFSQGTEEQAQKIQARLFVKKLNEQGGSRGYTMSFEDYVSEEIMEREGFEELHEVTEEDFQEFMKEMTLHYHSHEYNEGYKCIDDMTNDDWADQRNGEWIDDEKFKEFEFDMVYL